MATFARGSDPKKCLAPRGCPLGDSSAGRGDARGNECERERHEPDDVVPRIFVGPALVAPGSDPRSRGKGPSPARVPYLWLGCQKRQVRVALAVDDAL